MIHQLTQIVSQLGIADALFSGGETRAKKVVCSHRLGYDEIGMTVRASYLKGSPT